MPTYTFREVPLYGTKTVPCSGCGKKLRRQRKFSQTLNPFNKAADGRPKTAKQIQDELATEIRQWEQEPETCGACTNTD